MFVFCKTYWSIDGYGASDFITHYFIRTKSVDIQNPSHINPAILDAIPVIHSPEPCGEDIYLVSFVALSSQEFPSKSSHSLNKGNISDNSENYFHSWHWKARGYGKYKTGGRCIY